MNFYSRINIAFKAFNQLGPEPVVLNGLYRLGLATGTYKRLTSRAPGMNGAELMGVMPLPGREELCSSLGDEGVSTILAAADEIAGGKVRLFGGEPEELALRMPGKLEHWTAYETGKTPIPWESFPQQDIKFVWEPARFGWAFTLGRAYRLVGDEKYARAFWQFFETFTEANPPYLGPHWMSGQEVALRLLAFVWAGQVFASASASTPQRKASLAASVAAHAARIPPTLVYARSQQNNHLLSEAVGLLTAGLALPDHPRAASWRDQGWRWLNKGLQAQIDGYGEYSQHSTNYQRLVLQLVMWTDRLCRTDTGRTFRWPRQSLIGIRRAVHWLLALMDADTGRVPNLGANDGSYIFPLTVLPFDDYRPVLHASARMFLEYDLPHGAWDEMALWFGAQSAGRGSMSLPRYVGDQLYGKNSWAYLRTAQFNSRPSHADQLHFDLWWRGVNVTPDAGTYLYNAAAPWDNSLVTAWVHNTITVDGKDQFTRAGRFLYLDWYNAYRISLPSDDPSVLLRVRGRTRARGIRHTRIVSVSEDDGWLVEDEVLLLHMPWEKKQRTFRLHWLLPDWKWKLESAGPGILLHMESPHGPVTLSIRSSPSALPALFSLVRTGDLLAGSGSSGATRGWVSPDYGVKLPALSLAVEIKSENEVKFTSEFIFPK
jgi:hypothetical protein